MSSDAPRECAYILADGPDTLHIVDLQTRDLVRTVTLDRSRSCSGEAPLIGLRPRDIAVTPDGRKAFITTGACTVIVIDFTSDSIQPTIPFGSASSPGEIVMAPSGEKAFVTDPIDGIVASINASNNAVTDTHVLAGANVLEIDNAGRNLFVGGFQGLFQLSAASLQAPSEPSPLVDGRVDTLTISRDDAHLYVAGRISGSPGVTQIDTETFSITETIVLEGRLPSIALSPDGARLLVARPQSRRLDFFEASTLSSIGMLAIEGGIAHVAASRRESLAVVASGGLGGEVLFINAGSAALEGGIEITDCENSFCPPGFVCDLLAPCSPTSVTIAPCPRTPTCVGDCDGDGAVTVEEVVLAIDIALHGNLPRCPSLDVDASKVVTVDEIVRALTQALGGCLQG